MSLSRPTRPAISERLRSDEAYNLFIGQVVRVDFERMRVTIKDSRSSELIDEIYALPSSASSLETTETVMPEVGSMCLCCQL